MSAKKLIGEFTVTFPIEKIQGTADLLAEDIMMMAGVKDKLVSCLSPECTKKHSLKYLISLVIQRAVHAGFDSGVSITSASIMKMIDGSAVRVTPEENAYFEKLVAEKAGVIQ